MPLPSLPEKSPRSSPSSCRGFQLYGAGEKNAVLEMDMEMEVSLELAETLVGGLVTRAGLGGRFLSVCQGTYLPHQRAPTTVRYRPRMDRILHRPKKSSPHRLAA